MSWLLPTWLDHHHQGGQQVIFFSYFTKYLKQINFKNHHIFCTAGLTDNDEVAFSVKGAACPPVQVSRSRKKTWMLAPHSTWPQGCSPRSCRGSTSSPGRGCSTETTTSICYWWRMGKRWQEPLGGWVLIIIINPFAAVIIWATYNDSKYNF